MSIYRFLWYNFWLHSHVYRSNPLDGNFVFLQAPFQPQQQFPPLAVAPDPHTHTDYTHPPTHTHSLTHSFSTDLPSMGLPTASDLYTYDPSAAAAILFDVLYGLFIGPHFLLSCYRCRSRPIKHRYTLCLLIAAIIFTAGYSIRTASIQAKNRGNISLYATSSSLIVISPIFVCATLYLLLARLIQVYLPLQNQTFFNVPPRLLGKLFILSDATSFMTQGAGSAIAASGNWEGSSKTAGIDVLLVGLALQLSTFTFFLVVVWQFVCRVRLVEEGNFEPNLKKMLRGVFIASIFVEVSEMRPQPFLDGRRLLSFGECLLIGSLSLQIRSIYRVVEFALGIQGYPFQHEWPLYVLEATPMLFAIATLAVYHPVNLVQKSPRVASDNGTSLEDPKASSSNKFITRLVGSK